MKHILLLVLLVSVYNVNAIQQRPTFNLIISLYNETNSQRRQEYIQCLKNNLRNPLISTIFILYDNSKDNPKVPAQNALFNYLIKKPVRISITSGKPTFEQCRQIAHTYFPQSNVIIANADIYFNETLQHLATYDITNKFLALTRWNAQEDGSLIIENVCGIPFEFGQDAWIFRTSLTPFKETNIQLGTWACDDIIAFWALESGLKVLNPSLTIQACHLHRSDVRTWQPYTHHPLEKMIGVVPTTLEQEATEYPSLLMDLIEKNPTLVERVREQQRTVSGN